MNNYKFTISDDGVDYEYQVVRLLNIPNSEYQYVIYKDNNLEYFASRCEVIDGELELMPIEEDYEWEELDKVFQEVKDNE